MIQLIQRAKADLEGENAQLRSMCPACPPEGTMKCPRVTGNPRDDASDVAHSSVNLISQALLMLADACGPRLAPVAREALLAALTARNSAVEGDHEGVDEFSRVWLGIRQPEQWREAVEMALLGDWVHQLGRAVRDDPGVMELLRRDTQREHRRLQPLWERKVNGRRTNLLSQPVGTDLTLHDLLIESHTPESEALRGELEDSRISTVLRHLTSDEARVAATWAEVSDISWHQAALHAGLVATYGERVRRRLKRLGKQHTQREQAAALMSAGEA
ncbi:hypothetical protein [Streptomyces spinosisporus]|uniref:Sigma-70 family RNA polymerase sigma factor n=1 Tax=Streptomyces spinosisporus TaxID=2927582 RepID=A0ABS9XFN0_9ACTN|nr:hypothetical protein [Streptomyces spinosisporus]MCI3240889.1 hypothetical protein [Streptomyces spinosisporus]